MRREVEMIGRVEMARYRALEALLPDPTLADPDPSAKHKYSAGSGGVSESLRKSRDGDDQFSEGASIWSRLPDYLGPFQIRQLPEAFKPTSPGGFMNPPGVYDKDPDRILFHSDLQSAVEEFLYSRGDRRSAADPRPRRNSRALSCRLSIANHLTDEIRRQHQDGVFVEGWALYGEEMLMRTGLYPDNSAAQGQILRLSRYRAARIGVDVNLHTGQWTFEQAVKYFMEAGGLDREAAEGEAAGAASSPHAEDQLHHRQMADHEFARSLSEINRAPISGSGNFTTT